MRTYYIVSLPWQVGVSKRLIYLPLRPTLCRTLMFTSFYSSRSHKIIIVYCSIESWLPSSWSDSANKNICWLKVAIVIRFNHLLLKWKVADIGKGRLATCMTKILRAESPTQWWLTNCKDAIFNLENELSDPSRTVLSCFRQSITVEKAYIFSSKCTYTPHKYPSCTLAKYYMKHTW